MDGRKERDLFSVRKRKPLQNSGKRGKSSERAKREEYEPPAKTTKFSDDEPGPKRTLFTSDDEVEDDASDVNLEPLSYETLMAGLVTLGRISKVSDYGITVSLPFKIFGRVPITRISQAYTSLLKKVADAKENTDEADDEIFSLQSLFKAGQYVVAKVESIVKVEQRRKVDLCLMPQEINFGVAVTKLQKGVLIQCAVASVEDNGYVMETGISNVKVAFLKRADAQGAGIVGVGSVVHCVVTQVKASETGDTVNLKLSAVPKEVQETSNDVTETEDLSLLLPGTAIKTTIASVEKDYVKLLMAENDGVVSPYHLQSPLHQISKYQIGQKVIARVLYITPLSRVVHLTLQSDIYNESMAEEEPLHGISIGEQKEGQVFRVQKNGVYFKMGSCAAFCLKKYLTDKDNIQDDIHAEYPIGSAHTLCVMSYHNFDDIFVVSLQKSVLNQQIVGYGAIKIGQVLQATIKSYDAKSAVVSVATNVDGEIPFMHLTNTTVKHPEKKYAIGNTVEVRVLEVKPERRHLVLTCKKLLVNSKEPVVCKYDKELENKIVRGFIVQIKSRGLLVAFYGGVKGFVPKSEVSIEKLKDLEGHFRVGNVLKCKILSVDPEAQRMTLSLILYEEKVAEKKAKSKHALDVRSFVNCFVAGVTKDSVKVRVKPGNLRAEIPMHHLSDEGYRCRMLMGLLSQGDYISNALIFKKGKNVVLTMKDTMCRWIRKSKLSSQENFVESYAYPAVVSEVVPEGVRVSVPVGENTQSILTQSSDLKENKAVDHAVGESIQVRCTGFKDDGEPVLSIQRKIGKSRKYLLQDLYNYFMHQNMLQKSLVRKGLATVEFGDIQMGHKLEMDIVAVTSLGLVVKHWDYSITGIVMKEHLQPDKKYEVGLRIPVCVLHVHVEERCVIVTARHDLIDLLYVNEFNKIQVGQMARCEVLLIQRDFVLVSLKSKHKGLMAYLPPRKTMAVGKTLSLAVKYVGDKIVLGVTKVQDKHKYFSVLSNLSNVNLQASKDNSQEFTDVEINEGSALELIKKVVCFSDKVQIEPVNEEVASINDVIPNGKGKKKSAKKEKNVGNSLEIDDVKMESAEREIDGVTGVKSGRKEKKKIVKKKEGEKRSKKSETSEVSLGEKQHSQSKIEEDDSGVDEMDLGEISKTPKRGKACLKLSTGFVWDIPEDKTKEDDNDETSGDEEDETKRKKSKKLSKVERELLAKEQEKRLHELESARLEKERLPQTALDYEELLQESPNSSAIWIQFISFHLENAEVDRARSIGKRALQVINVEEFEERINVWTVMLRLEVLYGTGESIDAAFNEAVSTNDALKIYFAMAMVYAESNKVKEAEDIYFKMSKKFSQNPDVWVKAGIFFYKNSKLEGGRKYMDRALLSLDKSHHLNLISRFAQLEFQFGEVERGRTMFETLLSNYPKRMDKWNVYVDLLAKRGDIEGARQVLERMTGLKLRLRQMRSVFKKFLEFEQVHGTPRNVESVKIRVQEYVSASLKEL